MVRCLVMYGEMFAISMTEQDYECQSSVMEFPQSHKYTRGPHPRSLYVQVTVGKVPSDIDSIRSWIGLHCKKFLKIHNGKLL